MIEKKLAMRIVIQEMRCPTIRWSRPEIQPDLPRVVE